MAGCNNCKYFKSELGDLKDGRFETKKTCSLGKTFEMNEWWNKNGKKNIDVDTLDAMNCHDYHDSIKALMRADQTADKLLDLLNKKER